MPDTMYYNAASNKITVTPVNTIKWEDRSCIPTIEHTTYVIQEPGFGTWTRDHPHYTLAIIMSVVWGFYLLIAFSRFISESCWPTTVIPNNNLDDEENDDRPAEPTN